MKTTHARSSTLDYLTVAPDHFEEGARFPLIFFLHGFGANKEDLAGLAPLIDRTGYVYVLPDAPLALADDPTMRAWYERGGKESPGAVRHALDQLEPFVNEVLDRFEVPPGQALLAGFSQGGAMTLRYGLPRPDLFAGLVVLSGSLRQVDAVRATLPEERTQPVFVAHGRHDPLVPFEWSKNLVAFLETEGYTPAYKSYGIGHEISPSLVADLRQWLRSVLPGAGT
ncbi:MAG: alpha/beta hydrolase [Gemmataceae bacterium]